MTPKFSNGQSCWPTIFEKLFRRCYKKNRPKTKNLLHHDILRTKTYIFGQSTRKNKIFAIIV